MEFLSGQELKGFMDRNRITAVELEAQSRVGDKKGVCRQTVQKAFGDQVSSLKTLGAIHRALADVLLTRMLAADALHYRLVALRWIADPAAPLEGTPAAVGVATAV